MVSERLHRAGARILDGDDSIAAAQGLEAALLEEYAEDERVQELLEHVARYGHEDLDPYAHAQEVRRLLLDTLERLGRKVTRVELFRRTQAWSFTVFEDPETTIDGQLPGHPLDFGAARKALVTQFRCDYPRILTLRWSATEAGHWVGRLPDHP